MTLPYGYKADDFISLRDAYDQAVARKQIPDILGSNQGPSNAAPTAPPIAPPPPQVTTSTSPTAAVPDEAAQAATAVTLGNLFGQKRPIGYMTRGGRPSGYDFAGTDFTSMLASLNPRIQKPGTSPANQTWDPDILDRIAQFLVQASRAGGAA